MTAALLLAACSFQGPTQALALRVAPAPGAPADTGTPPVDTVDTAPPPDTSPPPDTAPPAPHVEEEVVGEEGDLSARLFSDDVIHEIELNIDEAGWMSLEDDPYTYVSGDLTMDGERISAVGLRLKGKIGSYRSLAQKAAFKVDLNVFVTGRDVYGLHKFNLNNMVVDCSYMKEHLGYKVLRDAGLPALRAGWAWVRVNGVDYGLYNVLEQPDDDMLARNYEDPTGNLYDGKYIWYGGYSYTMMDFVASVQDMYVLEEGTDVGHADIHGVVDAIAASAGTPAYYETLGAVVDWDQVLRYLAWEQWVGHNDGYALNTNNNFVYFNPVDGRLNFLPWDLDYSFLEDYQWGMSWASPRGVLAYSCMTDGGDCHAAWKAAAASFIDQLDTADQIAYLDQIEALTADAVANDPRRECKATDVDNSKAAMRAWVTNRPANLRTWWGL